MEQYREEIGRSFMSRFGWNVLEDLAEFSPRLGASEGERKSLNRVRTAFEEAGLNSIEQQDFELKKWKRGPAELTLSNPRNVHLGGIALPGSPADTVEGKIVHLGYGLPDDFENRDLSGNIVICRSDVPDYYGRWIHRKEKYFRCVEKGAEAFLFQNHVKGCLPPTGSLGAGRDVMGPIPGMGISKEDGDQLARYAKRDGVNLRGRLSIQPEVEPGTSFNITGTLGPDTDREVLIGAHVDGHDISQAAIDNGAGTAILCDVANFLGSVEQDLETKVRFVGFGSEELGLIGSRACARSRNPDALKVVWNLDGIGRGRTLKIHSCKFEGIRETVENVARKLDHPIQTTPELVTHSDHWPFVWRGIPGAMVSSETGDKGRGFGHTKADTLEKVDVREIRNHAILAALITLESARQDVNIPSKTADEIKEELEESGEDQWIKAARGWPYSS